MTSSPIPALPGPTAQPNALDTFGLIGASVAGRQAERSAGLTARVVRLSWNDYQPSKRTFSASYESSKRREIDENLAAGFQVVLDLGIQDTPQWIHEERDSYLVNQYGERWMRTTDGDEPIDKSDANLVFNDDLRQLASRYVSRAMAAFGPGASAVRVGGGRWNETGFPAARTRANVNTYWGFDARAQASSPVPGWKPGQPSPKGEAAKFLRWYLDSLVNYQRWQIREVRKAFTGVVVVLLPSWGIRPGDENAAIAGNLSGRSAAEVNGELQRGYDFAGQVAAVDGPDMAVATTWIDAAPGDDEAKSAAAWRPVHFIRDLLTTRSDRIGLWGENTGAGDVAALKFSFDQATRYGVSGMVWFRGEQLGQGGNASLQHLGAAIATANESTW